MAYYVLAAYLGGLVAVPWFSWLVEGPLDAGRVVESVLWPLALIVATCRKLKEGRG